MTTRKSHKARGATFETDLRNYFRTNGYNAERLARTGARDEGDIVGPKKHNLKRSITQRLEDYRETRLLQRLSLKPGVRR